MKTKINRRWIRIIIAGSVFLATIAAFTGLNIIPEKWLMVQFGPALLSTASAFSAGTMAVVIIIVLATFVFGRFYCAILCPLGILQDIVAFLSRRKGKAQHNYKKLRYLIFAICVGLVASGWNLGYYLFGPYSNFGRMITSFTIGGTTPLVIIVALAVWKKRIYCTSVCPVGTLLGIFSKYGILQMHVADSCVSCGKCVKSCPAGCIDIKEKTVDNERCVRCMNCIKECPVGSIGFGRPEKEIVNTNPSRRAFLMNGGILVAGLVAGAGLAKTGMGALGEFVRKLKIIPPGAGNSERFAAKCTGCQLCTANCPSGIITPAPNGIGSVSLDLSKGACDYNCNKCSSICPTGAILPLTLSQKQKTRIALASFNPRSCIVFQEGKECGLCAKACPVNAITLFTSGAPKLNNEKCIGCGACQIICPAREKAMTIIPIDKQVEITAI